MIARGGQDYETKNEKRGSLGEGRILQPRKKMALVIAIVASIVLVGVAFAAPGSPLQKILPPGKEYIAKITSRMPTPEDLPPEVRMALRQKPESVGRNKAELRTTIEKGELPGKIVDASGPSTRGAEITVGGNKIKLPPDAFIEGVIVDIMCIEDPCPETPVLVLQRGNSKIWISEPTGEIIQRVISQGEENAFDFLRESGVGE